MSDEETLCPCPYCGEELADMDEMWRQLHINSCAPKEKEKKTDSQQCD